MAKLTLSFPEFRHAPSVVCGTGSIRALAELDDGETFFFTSGQERVNDLLSGALSKGGGTLHSGNALRKPPGEPTHELVRLAADRLRARPARRIVAVGGGSVLDWARLAWADSLGALDLASGKLVSPHHLEARPELWLVPTTCGTGAEAADVAVFRAASGLKAAVVSPAFLADKVVLDGRFLDALSPQRLAAFLCDALSHALEAWLSLVPLRLGKETALCAFGLITSSFGEPAASSRSDRLMEGSFLGGTAAANCSVGIVHAFAHSVGVDGIGHGLANACALRAGLEFNAGTPQMQSLLRRLNLDGLAALYGLVQPVVGAALEGIARHPVALRLLEADYQRLVASRMAADVAIRSNPRRASPDELLEFVRAVAAQLQAP